MDIPTLVIITLVIIVLLITVVIRVYKTNQKFLVIYQHLLKILSDENSQIESVERSLNHIKNKDLMTALIELKTSYLHHHHEDIHEAIQYLQKIIYK